MFSFKLTFNDALRCLILELLLILYIFDIVPYFGPDKIGTRIYLSLFAFIYVLYKFQRNRYYWIIIISNWTQVLFSVLTAIANGTTDFWYVQFALRNILYINGALLIASIVKPTWSYSDYIKLIILSITINSIIAATAFFVPSFSAFLFSIQNYSNEEQMEAMAMWKVRMAGLGISKFFSGGIINGMGIILTFWLLAKKEINLIAALILLVVLFIIGVFIARTVIVGFALGFLFYFYYTKTVRLYSVIGGFIVVFFLAYLLFFEQVNTSHAFEFFTVESDAFSESESLSSLKNMYDVDMSFSTFLIGDGMSKGGGHIYYMGVDVGWLRNIFYFGILGTLFGYLYYEYVIHRILYKLSGVGMAFVVTWFSYLLILNFKGLPDFNYMLFLLIAYPLNRYRRTQSINRSNRLRQKIWHLNNSHTIH